MSFLPYMPIVISLEKRWQRWECTPLSQASNILVLFTTCVCRCHRFLSPYFHTIWQKQKINLKSNWTTAKVFLSNQWCESELILDIDINMYIASFRLKSQIIWNSCKISCKTLLSWYMETIRTSNSVFRRTTFLSKKLFPVQDIWRQANLPWNWFWRYLDLFSKSGSHWRPREICQSYCSHVKVGQQQRSSIT